MTVTEIRKNLDKACKTGRYKVENVLKALDCHYIGNGIHRSVYSIGGTNTYILKIEHDHGKFDSEPNFRNVTEYMHWCDFKGSCYEKWLARVYFITYDGRISIQHRAKPVTLDEMPKRIPPFFCDTKL